MIRRIPAERRTLELVANTALSPSVRKLVFRTTDERPFDYLAGQWVKLTLPSGLERDYSIASAPCADLTHDDARRFELAVTRVEGGAGSTELTGLDVGTRVGCLGPNGLFVREDRHFDVPALYVATGTGLAPLRAMLHEELARTDEGPPQVLLFGARTEADILHREELEALAQRHPRFRYEVTLSQPSSAWTGRRGYVQTHLAELAAPLLPAHFYLCGLSRMVDAVRTLTKESLGVDRRFLHSERYD